MFNVGSLRVMSRTLYKYNGATFLVTVIRYPLADPLFVSLFILKIEYVVCI